MSTEYEYDENGNLTKDLNKNITAIQYNCLNLPSRVMFANGNSISYLYDAAGRKLRTVHVLEGDSVTTDYCGNVVYENGVPQILLTEVGYVSLTDGQYHYYLKDHQGNNRVVVDEEGTVEEVNHYYPFGGVFSSTGDAQPYKYNGKELDRKGGLDWYDYGARMYDAALGRFMKTDRFSEKYVSLSPYQYGANNPVNNIDVNGDSLLLNKTSVAEAMLAIYNGLEDGTNIKMKFNNGVLDPTSIEAHAKVTSDFFLQDLYEIATNEKMVELSVSDKNTFIMNEFLDKKNIVKLKEELKSIPSEVRKIDFINRKDLTDKTIFTIDGDDTKDIDDAISIEKKGNNYILGVHIADVSYYVKENSYIDKSAREKATSVYMPGVVFPMYPVFLSNGICSLNPDVDRCSISCVMEIDKNGKLIDFDIFKSVIHSRIQMTYKKVNKILEENIIDDEYKLYVNDLKLMKELSDILHNMRVKRGLLDFDREEIKIETDINGKVTNISKRITKTGENIIEEFMLMANECVATYIYNMGLTSIYRIHDIPNEERLIKTINVIKNYGEKLDIKLNVKSFKVVQKLLEELKNSPKYNIYSYMILRCMAKAEYSNVNEGHFGIGIDSYKNEAYTHFTSPIRRYPDTTIHRILTNILEGNIEKIESSAY